MGTTTPHRTQLFAWVRLARALAPKGAARSGSAREVLRGARRLAAILPRDPKWARLAAPWLRPGLLKAVLTAYGGPSQLAATVAMVGGVTALDALERRRLRR